MSSKVMRFPIFYRIGGSASPTPPPPPPPDFIRAQNVIDDYVADHPVQHAEDGMGEMDES